MDLDTNTFNSSERKRLIRLRLIHLHHFCFFTTKLSILCSKGFSNKVHDSQKVFIASLVPQVQLTTKPPEEVGDSTVVRTVGVSVDSTTDDRTVGVSVGNEDYLYTKETSINSQHRKQNSIQHLLERSVLHFNLKAEKGMAFISDSRRRTETKGGVSSTSFPLQRNVSATVHTFQSLSFHNSRYRNCLLLPFYCQSFISNLSILQFCVSLLSKLHLPIVSFPSSRLTHLVQHNTKNSTQSIQHKYLTQVYSTYRIQHTQTHTTFNTSI